jgi:Flp pilus assembly protein TadG
MLKRWLRGWFVDDAGSVAVEMAIVTPLLLLLLLGAADFAKVYRMQMVLVGAAKAGAQYGSQSKLTASDVAGMENAALDDADGIGGLEAAAQTICRCGGSSVACTAVCSGGTAPELFVQVTASGTFTTAFRYPGIPEEIPLAQTTVMRVD